MCKCIDTLNAKLAETNTKLSEGWVFGHQDMRLLMVTVKVDETRRGKPVTALAGAFCTWCGKRYSDSAHEPRTGE